MPVVVRGDRMAGDSNAKVAHPFLRVLEFRLRGTGRGGGGGMLPAAWTCWQVLHGVTMTEGGCPMPPEARLAFSLWPLQRGDSLPSPHTMAIPPPPPCPHSAPGDSPALLAVPGPARDNSHNAALWGQAMNPPAP